MLRPSLSSAFFFFNDTATTEIYTLSLPAALPISRREPTPSGPRTRPPCPAPARSSITRPQPPSHLPEPGRQRDRKSTLLNSSHLVISYAVFCLKKKKK